MGRIVCTVITPDYLDRALAVLMSLRRGGCDLPMVVLTTGPVTIQIPGISTISLEELSNRDARARQVATKYEGNLDVIRWSLKPVLLSHLLRTNPSSEVLYCDSDVCFFGAPDELFAFLETGGVVLTPHWRPPYPFPSTRQFRLNFMDGLFNAGCVAANARGVNALDWWAAVCLVACEKNHEQGLHDDQRYLDLMPIYFPETVVCRHFGFNLADWNLHLRMPNRQGLRRVPDQWPVRLVHFTKRTIEAIQAGHDAVLQPYLIQYQEILEAAARGLAELSASEGSAHD